MPELAVMEPLELIRMASSFDGPISKRNVLVSAEAILARFPSVFAKTKFGPIVVESASKVS